MSSFLPAFSTGMRSTRAGACSETGVEARDRLLQPVDLDRLDQVVGRLDLERLHRVLGVGGDEDDRRRPRMRGQGLGELHAGQTGHVDVEEDDVVRDGLDELQRLDRVARLADDLDAARLAQQEAQLRPCRSLVVDDQCLEHPASSPASSRRGVARGLRDRPSVSVIRRAAHPRDTTPMHVALPHLCEA